MRYRGNIFYGINFKAGSLEGTDSRFTTGSRSFNIYFDLPHTMLHSYFGRRFRGKLCGKGSRFAGPLEAHIAGTGPRYTISVDISYADKGIVKSRLNMSNPSLNIFSFPALGAGGFLLNQFFSVPPFWIRLFFAADTDSFTRSFAGPSIIFRFLPPYRQATAMSDAAVTADLDQALDI